MKNRTEPLQNKVAFDFTKTIDFYVEIGVYIVLVCNFFILLGNSQGITFFVSWPTRIMVSYIFLLAIYLFYDRARNNRVDRLDALYVALVITTLVCYLFTCRGSFLTKAVQYMCFLMFSGCFVLYRRIKNVKQIKHAVYIANIIYALLLIFLSFMKNSHYYFGEYGLRIVQELTLGYTNPNETAIYLMLPFFVMLSAVFSIKANWKKYALAALAAQLLYMVWATKSRTCIILCVVALVLILTRQIFRIGNISIAAVTLLPLIAFLVIMLFPEWVTTQTVMGEVADTGRYHLFGSFFNKSSLESVIIGDFLSYGGSNMHNSFLSIMAMFGLPVAILYIFFLHRALQNYKTCNNSLENYASFVGLLMVVAHGVSEGTLLVSGTVYAGMAGLLLILALPEESAV